MFEDRPRKLELPPAQAYPSLMKQSTADDATKIRVAEASQSATNCGTVLPKESAAAVGSCGQMVKQTRVLVAP